MAGLRARALQAVGEGAGALFVRSGPLGDPLVLLAGLSPSVPRVLLGALARPGRGRSTPRPACPRRDEPRPRLRRSQRGVLHPALRRPPRRGRRPLPRPVARWPGGRRRPVLPRAGRRQPSTPRRPGPARRARSHRRRGSRPSRRGSGPARAPDRRSVGVPGGTPVTDATLVHELPGFPRPADRRHRPSPAGPQRLAGGRGHRRGCLPPPVRVGVGRVPGRRPLLRAVGFPHHHAPARGVGRHRPPRPGRLLGTAGAAAAAGAVPRGRRAGPLPDPQRRLRGARLQRPDRPARSAGRRHLHLALREQLALHLHAPVLLRPVLVTLTVAAHVVAGDRRAVLPRVASGRPAPPAPGPAQLAADRRWRSPSAWGSCRPSSWRSCSTRGSIPPGSTTGPTHGSST